MFKFFPDDVATQQKSEVDNEKAAEINFLPSKEVAICESHYTLVSQFSWLSKTDTSSRVFTSDIKVSRRVNLKCVNLSELSKAEAIEKNEKVLDLLKSTSDLVSGVYEGGFKTWECTFDLVNFLETNFESIFVNCRDSNNEKRPVLRILDLGCGSGLAGLSVLKLAEEAGLDVRVDFQDYNEEVLDYITIPNSLLNFDDENVAKCRYFSGDWDSFRDLISSTSLPSTYDIILSSETIYNLDYFPKILKILKSSLNTSDQRSCVYLAAKTVYFGVGGGTKAFLKMINEDNELEASVVHLIKDGVQREILRIRPQLKESS